MSEMDIEKKKKFAKKYDYCVTVVAEKIPMGVYYTNVSPIIEDENTLVITIGESEESYDKILYFNMAHVVSYGISRVRKES